MGLHALSEAGAYRVAGRVFLAFAAIHLLALVLVRPFCDRRGRSLSRAVWSDRAPIGLRTWSGSMAKAPREPAQS